jgi:putative redox protein
MKATVEWNGGVGFTGVATSGSGVPILMESGYSKEGSNLAARPMELIAIGLAGCLAMDVLSILEKKRQKVVSYRVNVDAPRSPEYQKVFTSALITFILTGIQIDEHALLRSIELAATKYCPAHAMLADVFPISIGYEIYEGGEREYNQLIHRGTWQDPSPQDLESNI